MVKIFVSQLEEIMAAEELHFKATAAFGTYKRFLSHAIAHPAKFNTKLLEFLIEQHTGKGDVVLDCMAGSGSTGVVAALHGRNAISLELEEKFYKWMEKARKKVEIQETLALKGKIMNIHGDARKLSELLKEVDVVISSPPYATDKGGEKGLLVHDDQRQKGKSIYKTYSEDANNIDNKPYGSVDAIISSPPYADTNDRKGRKMDSTRGIKGRATDLPQSPENIGNLSKQTYLEAMQQVYAEMFKVLKPQGLAMICIKPFIRNKQVVDLPYHTWLLMQRVGFKLIKLYKLKLKQKSFWRIIYYKKYPQVPRLRHEYVLVCMKSA